eukprot:17635-Heterococcus_DN1.PRE.3
MLRAGHVVLLQRFRTQQLIFSLELPLQAKEMLQAAQVAAQKLCAGRWLRVEELEMLISWLPCHLKLVLASNYIDFSGASNTLKLSFAGVKYYEFVGRMANVVKAVA